MTKRGYVIGSGGWEWGGFYFRLHDLGESRSEKMTWEVRSE